MAGGALAVVQGLAGGVRRGAAPCHLDSDPGGSCCGARTLQDTGAVPHSTVLTVDGDHRVDVPREAVGRQGEASRSRGVQAMRPLQAEHVVAIAKATLDTAE